MLDGVLENIVFLEMKRRGYDVILERTEQRIDLWSTSE